MKIQHFIAYSWLRITFGVMLFAYGVGKFFTGIDTFAEGLQDRFAGQLPDLFVTPFAYALPFVELILGVFIIFGLKTLSSLVVAAILMMILTFGAVMEPNPPTVANNMLFAFIVFVLIWKIEANEYSIDRKFLDS